MLLNSSQPWLQDIDQVVCSKKSTLNAWLERPIAAGCKLQVVVQQQQRFFRGFCLGMVPALDLLHCDGRQGLSGYYLQRIEHAFGQVSIRGVQVGSGPGAGTVNSNAVFMATSRA